MNYFLCYFLFARYDTNEKNVTFTRKENIRPLKFCNQTRLSYVLITCRFFGTYKKYEAFQSSSHLIAILGVCVYLLHDLKCFLTF